MRACVHRRLCDDVLKAHGFVVSGSCPHNCRWYDAVSEQNPNRKRGHDFQNTKKRKK